MRQATNVTPPTSVTDTATNTYVRATGADATWNASNFLSIWIAENITGHATNVITLTFNGDHAFSSMICFQFSGLLTSGVLDQAAAGANAGAGQTSIATAAFTTTQATEAIFVFGTAGNLSNTFTAGLIGGASATAVVADGAGGSQHAAAEYLIVSAIQTTATAAIGFSSSTGAEIGVVTLKGVEVASGAGGLALMGSGK